MAEENYFTDALDIQFHFKHTLEWKRIIPLVESSFQAEEGFATPEEALEFYQQLLETVGKFIPAEVKPRVKAIDKKGSHFSQGEIQNPPELEELLKSFKEMGLHSLIQAREFGGFNAPFAVQCILVEMMSREDLASFTNISFHNAVSEFLFMFSLLEGTTVIREGKIVESRFKKAIEEMVSGKTWGAMVLTEPNAGSDLGNLQTRGATRRRTLGFKRE
jgi:alkylation response protein AidB-like acyl-CoA dehydrogenase